MSSNGMVVAMIRGKTRNAFPSLDVGEGKPGRIGEPDPLGVQLQWSGRLLSSDQAGRESALSYYGGLKEKGKEPEKELALDVLSTGIRYEAGKADGSHGTENVFRLAEALTALGDERGAKPIREASEKIASYGFREDAEKLKEMANALGTEPQANERYRELFKKRAP